MSRRSVAARFEVEVTPDAVIAVDESLCIVLRTPERTIVITNVDQLRAALDDAQTFARVRAIEAACEEQGYRPEALRAMTFAELRRTADEHGFPYTDEELRAAERAGRAYAAAYDALTAREDDR